ncbi:MAG TPA: ThuA domain-containing protein [Pirellulales bacterium]|nr:ThuA domain-containing protein [Pirellulales bacterium]
MTRTHAFRWFSLTLMGLVFSGQPARAADGQPLKTLLIAGGCCHDYAKQKDLLKQGLEARANVEVTIVYSPDTTTKARFDIYENPDWAKGYDVVIHDECTSQVTDMPYLRNILNAHKSGVPAVNLHCAMHSYRVGTNDWFEFVGIQSAKHGPQLPIGITFVDKEHPVTRGLADWTTINEELYNNVTVLDSATPLARGKQKLEKGESDFVVAWANQYGKTRVFSTTIGHNNDTVGDPRYLDLVTRGLLWSCDKLNGDYLKVKAQ